MASSRGRYFRLSLPRRWIGDLLYFARQVPTVPVERVMNLGELSQTRERIGVSWPALFLKAFGMVSRHYPELRQSIIRYPWTRMYEHPCSVASVAIERRYLEEPAVFFGQIRAPEEQSLEEIDEYLKKYKLEPISTFGLFRRQIRIAKWPLLLRRFAWWQSLNWSGDKRAKRLGTFGFSVYASIGASSLHPLSPLSYLLNYGVIEDDGRMSVRLIYDHRVVDGALVARALATMESVLTGQLLDELTAYEHVLQGSENHAQEEQFPHRRIESLVSR